MSCFRSGLLRTGAWSPLFLDVAHLKRHGSTKLSSQSESVVTDKCKRSLIPSPCSSLEDAVCNDTLEGTPWVVLEGWVSIRYRTSHAEWFHSAQDVAERTGNSCRGNRTEVVLQQINNCSRWLNVSDWNVFILLHNLPVDRYGQHRLEVHATHWVFVVFDKSAHGGWTKHPRIVWIKTESARTFMFFTSLI